MNKNKIANFILLNNVIFSLIYSSFYFFYIERQFPLLAVTNICASGIIFNFKNAKLKIHITLAIMVMMCLHASFFTGGIFSYLMISLIVFPLVVGMSGDRKEVVAWLAFEAVALISYSLFVQEYTMNKLGEGTAKLLIYTLTIITLIGFTSFFTFLMMTLNDKILRFNRKKYEINNILYSYRSFASMSHELNNSLMKILSEAELLKRKGVNNSIANHIQELMNKIEDDYTSVANKKKEGLVCNLIKELECDNFKIYDNSNLDFKVNIYLLEQIFDVLFSNAKDSKANNISAILNISKDYLVISFSDDGEKIKEPEKIFNPFYSSKSILSNKGMGLSSLKLLLDLNNGKIRLKNIDRKVFEVKIPLKNLKI